MPDINLTLNPLACCSIGIALFFSFAAAVDQGHAHSGGLNKSGCHSNGSTGQYHCHRQSNNSSSASNKMPSLMDENYYNQQLAAQLGGQTEVTIDFNYGLKGHASKQASIRIDIVTDLYAIEGGLDKRSSLDSIQQAVFAATQLGLKPAVAIYDTDNSWGKYEHRIWQVAQKLGIQFIWVSQGKVIKK